MKYNKEIQKQYEVQKLKREIKQLSKVIKELESERIRLSLHRQSRILKLRGRGIKFYW